MFVFRIYNCGYLLRICPNTFSRYYVIQISHMIVEPVTQFGTEHCDIVKIPSSFWKWSFELLPHRPNTLKSLNTKSISFSNVAGTFQRANRTNISWECCFLFVFAFNKPSSKNRYRLSALYIGMSTSIAIWMWTFVIFSNLSCFTRSSIMTETLAPVSTVTLPSHNLVFCDEEYCRDIVFQRFPCWYWQSSWV